MISKTVIFSWYIFPFFDCFFSAPELMEESNMPMTNDLKLKRGSPFRWPIHTRTSVNNFCCQLLYMEEGLHIKFAVNNDNFYLHNINRPAEWRPPIENTCNAVQDNHDGIKPRSGF
jgi:hypothetical protein